MKVKTSFLLSILFLSLCSLATADWQGSYIGGSINYEHFYGKRTDQDISGGMFTSISDNQSFRANEAGFNLFTGFLCNICNTCWYWGLEPYAGYKFNETTLNTSSPQVEGIELSRKWDVGVDLRIGRSFRENTFVYGKIGPEIGFFKFTRSNPNFTHSDSQWAAGTHVGLGIEQQFKSFRVGVEVGYSQYIKKKFVAYDNNSNDGATLESNPHILSLNLRFSIPIH